MTTRAFIFDVFGTCVDWRSSVARDLPRHIPGLTDPVGFAREWRSLYDPSMAPIRSGAAPYRALDDLHLDNLRILLRRHDLHCPDPEQTARLWERLSPWPDTVPGLRALREQAIIAPCSNGSIALMTHLARFAGLPWDCILGAEIANQYKPHPEVYKAACAALRLPPEQVTMVAAHNGDLHAARACGLKTAFLPRPMEYGPGQTTDLTPEADWDYLAQDLLHLAQII